ncbi:tetratricopeptide repeat protein 33-like isoform X4 [Mizuhopecten yessoensis]|uniref:tetratricopeptide repeat protein 33-like isoform X4 n=1 Tax=Mizuhopecten yessoensis TaxID=6573 RepID=UPI000B458D25|nr:tetratricopeptide repeat protein 33-like isoform X4 [Mizuhopecten yessoensis]
MNHRRLAQKTLDPYHFAPFCSHRPSLRLFQKMTAFGWKRKVGEKVARTASAAFESDAKDEENPEDLDVDWLTLVPPRKIICLEDAIAKSNRLKQEGTVLADSERYWEAIRKWDEAIKLTSTDETLYEMKSQVFLILCELYPAVHMGERAVDLKPTWWVAHQTLGRARLGMGEVKLNVGFIASLEFWDAN